MKRLIAACLICCAAAANAQSGPAVESSAGPGAGPSAEPAALQVEVPHQVLVLFTLPATRFRAEGHYSGGNASGAAHAARRRVALALASEHGLSLGPDWPMPILGLDCYVMDVPERLSPQDVAEQLARDPRVVSAQAMNLFRSLAHDDPLFSLQPAAGAWHLGELHAVATGRDVRVAVIDSAIQRDHPDLSGQIASNADFVAGDVNPKGAALRRPFPAGIEESGEATFPRESPGELHGTAVAGIIAARADNHAGIAGVAPQARLLALRACWQASPAETVCSTLSLALALHAAIERRAQVINLSLAGPPDRLIQQLVEAALGRGIGVVAAVDRSAPNGGFPAGLRGVVAVVDRATANAPPNTVIAAGTDVPTTLPDSRWAIVSGASYAAAHVSGLLALMLDAQAKAGRASRADTPIAADLVVQADGQVDACASLKRVTEACVCACGTDAPTESMARH